MIGALFMKNNRKYTVKKTAAVISAVIMMTTCAAALPASAEEIAAENTIECSIGSLARPKITKVVRYKYSVTLKWNKVKGATGYKIYKKVGQKYKVAATVRNGSTVKLKIKKLKTGKKYSFKVRAFRKKSGKTTWSKYSAAKSVVTKPDYRAYEPAFSNCAHFYSEEGFSEYDSWYYFEDLDHDGIKELLVHPNTCEANSQLFIYRFNEGNPCWTDSVSFGHSTLLKNGKKYYLFHAFQGYWSVDRMRYSNGNVRTSYITGGETDTGDYPFSDYGENAQWHDYYDKDPFYN